MRLPSGESVAFVTVYYACYSHLDDLTLRFNSPAGVQSSEMHRQAFDWHQRQHAYNLSDTMVVVLEPRRSVVLTLCCSRLVQWETNGH